MIEINRPTIPLDKDREMENLRAENESLTSKLTYIAMLDHPEILDDEEVTDGAE